MTKKKNCSPPTRGDAFLAGHLRDADLELAVLRHLASRARSVRAGLAWRQAAQRQAIRVARLVRLVPRLVPGLRATRSRVAAGWCVSTDEGGVRADVMTFHTRTARRTLADLIAPFVVRVHRPDLVDVPALGRLESEGLVVVQGGP